MNTGATRRDIDLRDAVGHDIFHQGTRPTCVTFAVSASHQAHRTTRGPGQLYLAPEAIWWFCHSRGLAGKDGMTLGSAAMALEGAGQPELGVWSYNPNLGHGTESPPTAAGLPPWNRARLHRVALRFDGIEAAIEDCLEAGMPVVLTIEVTDEFERVDTSGIVKVPDIRTPIGGYHAVVCVGAATHPSDGRFLLIKNSWGSKWGLGGYAWLPVSYLRAFGGDAGAIHNGMELDA